MKRRDFLAASITSYVAAIAHHGRPAQAQRQYQSLQEFDPWTSDNVFLQGINAPVFHEAEIDRLEVTGTIPTDLEGIYLRNGPNPMFRPITYHYPLEGDGMLHAVYFEAGRVRYRNRWIRTQGLVYEMAAGKALPELRFRNYANTNIVSHAGRLLALYEIGLPYQITPELDTIGEWDFQGAIAQSMTAHPRFDPQTGELHFYRYSLFTPPFLTYYVANAAGEVVRSLPINLPQPALLHDMAMTETYAIFFQCPLVFDLQQAMQCGMPFVWRSQQPTRIGLINRRDVQQAPIWIETEPFWMWHFMNAFEANGAITIDFVYYPEIQLDSTLEALLSHRPSFQRMLIDLDTKTVKRQILDDRPLEFPVFDHQQTGQSYRFGYLSHTSFQIAVQKGIPNYFPELIQYDVVHQTSKVHRFGAGRYGGEAVIVPKSNRASESDCYVMTWVFDENRQSSDLVILDAAHFDQEPIAKIHLPIRVPMGAHGNWVAQMRSA